MGMTLVLAEKPSAARNFAKALGGNSGTFGGEEYEICALRGHILELVPPPEQVGDELRERYRKWSLDRLPWDMNDMAWRKTTRGDVAEVVSRLRGACARADEVAIATDDDPSGEGELLAWEALDLVGWHGRTTRMYFTDEAPKSVQTAFRERREIPSMEQDGDWAKAWCRERWDFMSMQLTRAATCVAKSQGFGTVVRQGRLKSVIVWLVGEQQRAYESYKKVPFFEARFKDENGVTYAVPEEDAERFATAAEVDLSRLRESDVVCDSRTMRRKAPGRLLDLAGLSAVLATKGFKPKEILDTYQKMYEDQVVSYPRTEDKQITPEQFDELLPLAADIAGVVGVDPSLLTHREPRKTHVREGGAHGANRPGPSVPTSLDALSKYGPSARAIYETLARNYLAMLAEDYEYEQVKGHVKDFPSFVGKTNVPVKPGFKAVFDADDASSDEADEEETRDLGRRATPFAYEGANKRPQRPTQKWLKSRLERHNVGTGATRVSTLADISADGSEKSLLKNKKGVLSLTDCGKVSHALLSGCEIASPEATEALFSAMEEVGRFERDGDEVVRGISDLVTHDLEAMRANAGRLAGLGVDLSGGRSAVGRCPRCGEPVVKSRSGKVYFCTSRKSRRREDGSWELVAEGCGFKFSSSVCGKRLSDKQAASLLEGKTVRMSGLKSKSGKTFSAGVRASRDSEGGTELVFDAAGKSRPKRRGRR